MSKIIIRQASAKDQAQILEQWIQLSQYLPQQHDKPFGDLLPEKRTPQIETALQNTLASDKAAIFVCEYDGQIIASIAVVLNKQLGYSLPESSVVFNLWVGEGFRRQGVASLLLEKTYSWLAAYNVDSVQVGWHPGNVEADAFWKAHGFSQYEVIAAHRLNRK